MFYVLKVVVLEKNMMPKISKSLDYSLRMSTSLLFYTMSLFRLALPNLCWTGYRYRAHWLLDNLPSATKLKVDERVTYLHGFPIGFIDTTGGQHMFNHYVLVIKTHQVVEGSHRIVGFEVKAGSFATDTYKVEPDGTCSITTEKRADGTVATPRPLILTTPTNGKKQRVIWSYGVHFEKSDIAWASRWDTYLQMADVKIHWSVKTTTDRLRAVV